MMSELNKIYIAQEEIFKIVTTPCAIYDSKARDIHYKKLIWDVLVKLANTCQSCDGEGTINHDIPYGDGEMAAELICPECEGEGVE